MANESAGDETRLAGFINDQRTIQGLPPLAVDTYLTELARWRSADQVARGYFAHTTPDGKTIFDILDDEGVTWRSAGENLAKSQGVDPAQAAIDGFMNSPPHRANVLGPNYGRAGVGEALADDGTAILTVIFTD